MGIEAVIALIAGVIGLITVVMKAMQNRKANRNEIGKVESTELKAGMDAVDAAAPAPPGVQPVSKD